MRFRFLAVLAFFAAPSFASARPTIDSDVTVRAAAILTNAFVGSTSMETPYSNQLNCYVTYTKGSLTSIEVKAQFSPNDTTWYDEQERQAASVTELSGVADPNTVSIGIVYPKVYQFTKVSGLALISTPNLGRFMRLAVRGTGTVTSSTVTIRCVAGAI